MPRLRAAAPRKGRSLPVRPWPGGPRPWETRVRTPRRFRADAAVPGCSNAAAAGPWLAHSGEVFQLHVSGLQVDLGAQQQLERGGLCPEQAADLDTNHVVLMHPLV